MLTKRLILMLIISSISAMPYEMCTFIMKHHPSMGNDLDTITNQVTYTDCCIQCSKNDKCTAYEWNWKTQECYLKSDSSTHIKLHLGK